MGLRDLNWAEGTHLNDPILVAEYQGCILHVDQSPDMNGNYQWWVQNREDTGITEIGGASETQEQAKADCYAVRTRLGHILRAV